MNSEQRPHHVLCVEGRAWEEHHHHHRGRFGDAATSQRSKDHTASSSFIIIIIIIIITIITAEIDNTGCCCWSQIKGEAARWWVAGCRSVGGGVGGVVAWWRGGCWLAPNLLCSTCSSKVRAPPLPPSPVVPPPRPRLAARSLARRPTDNDPTIQRSNALLGRGSRVMCCGLRCVAPSVTNERMRTSDENEW